MNYQQETNLFSDLQDLEDLQEINLTNFNNTNIEQPQNLNVDTIKEPFTSDLQIEEIPTDLEPFESNNSTEIQTEPSNYEQMAGGKKEEPIVNNLQNIQNLDSNQMEIMDDNFENVDNIEEIDNIENLQNLENLDNNDIELEEENNSNEENDNNELKNKLDLERGTMIEIKDDNRKYIIVQVKNVFFEKNQNKFIRNYKTREVKNNKLSHELFNINSEDIMNIIHVDEVKKNYNDLEYSEEGDKEIDLEEYVEEVNDNNSNINNNLVELTDLDLDISEDYIEEMDGENSFDFEEILDDNIILDIEKELEESQILFTENEQEEDILDELVRLHSQKKKLSKSDIGKIAKQIRLLQFLKYKFSQHSLYKNNDNVDINSLKQKIIHKTQNYKPLLTKYLNDEFDNNYLIPVVHSVNRIYEKEMESQGELSNEIMNQIESIEKVHQKYKNNNELNYESITSELESLIKTRKIDNKNSVLNPTKFKNDTYVISNLDISNTEEPINEEVYLGEDIRKNEFEELVKVTNAEKANVVSYLHIPKIFQDKKKSIIDIYHDELNNENIEIKNINANERFKEGQKVKVCVENSEIVGHIRKNVRGFIYLEPIDDTIIDKENDILEFNSNSKMIKINLLDDVVESNGKCPVKNDKAKLYLIPTFSDKVKKIDVLEQLIPSVRQILATNDLNNLVNIQQLNNILGKYELNYHDLEINNAKMVYKLFNKNEKIMQNESAKNYAKINRMKKTYFKDLKDEFTKRKIDGELITNENLNELGEFYTQYLYKNYTFDGDLERLSWLHHQEDFGKLLINMRILFQMQNEKKQIKIADLEGKLKEIREENLRIKGKLDIETAKNDFFKPNKPNKCRNMKMKVVKIYLNIMDLEKDNFTSVTVDDFYKIGDISLPINKVKPGDYCILKHPNNPSKNVDKIDLNDKIFIRIKSDEQELWALQSKLLISDFLKESAEYCNTFIGNDEEKCALDKKKGQCVPERIERLRRGYQDNEDIINKLENRIHIMNKVDKEELVKKRILYLKNRGKMNLLREKYMKEKKIKEVKNERETSLEIDNDDITYDFIKQLEEELQNPEKRRDLLLDLKDKYGIDFFDDEKVGELYTQGDFNERGQRVEIAEVLPGSEKEIIEQSNNDILDALRHYLTDSLEETNDSENLEIINSIINTFTKIMGVNIEIEKIANICEIFADDSIMTKDEFINEKYIYKNKKIPKKSKILSQYNAYKLQNIIFITTANLLIHLQLELTNYFMMPFEKCASTIYGYPLTDKENMDSIEYMACVLNSLSQSGKYWESISEYNKGKLVKKITSYVDLLVENINIRFKLDEKMKEIELEREKMEIIEQNYEWNEFRPPLKVMSDNWKKPVSIDLGDTDIKNKKSLKGGIEVFKEKQLWISGKIIDNINSIINNQDIRNIKYDPLPLLNACCIDDIDRDYDYLTFLLKNDVNGELKNYIDESKRMEQTCLGNKKDNALLYIKPTHNKQKLKSFVNNIFPKEKDIIKNKKLLNNFFKNYVSEGINRGQKRYFDEDNMCVLSGDFLNEIDGKAYSYKDYQNLIIDVHKNNVQMVEENESSLGNVENKFNLGNISLNKIKNVLDDNIFLENSFINNLVKKDINDILEKGTNLRLWDRLEQEIANEKKELVSTLSKTFDKKTTEKLENILNTIGYCHKLEDEDIKEIEFMELYDDKAIVKKIQKERKYKRIEKFVIKYITNYLNKYIVLIANNKYTVSKNTDSESSSLGMKKKNKVLNDLYDDEYGFLAKYKNSKCKKLFKNIRKEFKNINKISNIRGYKDILDCNDTIINKSRFNFNNSSKLLEFLFIYLLNCLTDKCDISKSPNKKDKKDKKKIDLDDDDENSLEIGSNNFNIMCSFIKDILLKVEEDRKFNNKYAQTSVEKNIKTKNEESKDRNLYVMELLDLETRRLRNELTKAGLTKYADLAKDFSKVIENEEVTHNLREEYKRIHGDNFSEDMFQTFKENREKDMRIEEEIRKDNETYLDAEGDDELEI